MSKYVIVVALMLGLGSYAKAQGGEGPCAKDRETLCAGIEPGDGKLFKCMKDNADKLSAECKAHQEKMKEHRKGMKEACADDVEKFCGETKPGKGRIMKCMKKHKEELSAACKEEMGQAKGMHKKMRQGK